MPILRIKDINGNWVEIPAIIGPEGPQGLQGLAGKDGYTPVKGVDYFDGEPGKDGLTTSVNGKEQVNGEITLTAEDVGADAAGTADLAVNAHNGLANAHSELFEQKLTKPFPVTIESDEEVTIVDNCEYLFANIGVLNMVGSKAKAHGFIYFSWDVMEVTVSVTGFTASAGDDITGAKYGEMWEFCCDSGFVIWKNWGEQSYESV